MTILWDPNPVTAESYSMALGSDVRRVDGPNQLSRLLNETGDMLVVIGPEVDADAACAWTEDCRIERPEVGVVLLRRRLEMGTLATALRAGVRDVLTVDDLTGLAEAIRRSREISTRMSGVHADSHTEGSVVTVFSAKGGVGKTTFSTNLAAYLVSTGAKVLLVDLDLAFGDVGISLQLLPQNSIIDLVSMSGHLDAEGLDSVVTHHSTGLDAACAPSEPSDADRIPGVTINELLRVARRKYDYVVIDTPPAFTEHVLAAFDSSDQLVLIATLDIPAIKNLRLTLDTLDLLGYPKESRVVVLNRSDAKVGLRAEDVVSAINQEIALNVPSSTAVPASVNRGVPIVLDEPKHPVSVALRQLADTHIRPLRSRQGESAANVHDGGSRRGRDRWRVMLGGNR
jgi:pilus assembly protein CpaE